MAGVRNMVPEESADSRHANWASSVLDNEAEIIAAAKEVLNISSRGDYTIPAAGLYPHQWLWDSCFIAIGIRHYDIERAQKEIKSLLRGQWHNGMLPNMIFADGEEHFRDRELWRSWLNPNAPDKVSTSGITQPPMVAEAVVNIGQKLTKPERRSWFKSIYPHLLRYHLWLYNERDPRGEGLTLQIHPWESGLDNTPPWMKAFHEHKLPMWVGILSSNIFQPLVRMIRRDLRFARSQERTTVYETLALYAVLRKIRRKNYDINQIAKRSFFAIEDLTFNSIFVRANHQLKYIAKIIGKQLPEELLESMQKTEAALESLWEAESGQYYSRNFVTQGLIIEPSIAALMPLYAGSISQERADQLVKLLVDKKSFGAKFPVPSVPLNSKWFDQYRYWQGPTWINTNWLIIQGLKRYGFDKEAEHIKQQMLEMIKRSGFYEYFSPLDGSPAGSRTLSWSAALMIDLLS